MPVLDLRGDKSRDASQGIIDIINAAAKAKTSQVEFQQKVMIDQLNRQRNREDAKLQAKDQAENWGAMFGGDQPVQPVKMPSPQGNPQTNNTGMANSATPQAVGDSPVSPVGGGMPGLPNPGETPLSSAFPITGGASRPQASQPGQTITIRGGSGKFMNIPLNGMAPEQAIEQAKQTGQNSGIFDTQEEAMAAAGNGGQPSATPTSAPTGQPQPQSQLTAQVSDQYTSLGFTPIGIGQLGLARKGAPEPKDFAYVQALNKVKRGTASEGEVQLVKDFNGVKGDTSPLQGIDTINLSPEQIGEELKAKNPGHYNFLESIKNGQYKVSGRSSKEMNKVVEQIQTIWPGTDLQALQARFDVRRDFTSGKTANNITALNTALSHLDKLSRSAEVLDNGSFRFGNKLGNVLKTQTGDSRVRVLDADIHAVTGELAGTFKQTGATDTEIKNFQHALDSADSKEVVQDIVDEFIHLIGGRTQPLLERWQNVFGVDSTFPVVGRSGQGVLARHGFEWDQKTGNVYHLGENGGGDTGGGQIYGGMTIQQAREQGFTQYDTDKDEWIK